MWLRSEPKMFTVERLIYFHENRLQTWEKRSLKDVRTGNIGTGRETRNKGQIIVKYEIIY